MVGSGVVKCSAMFSDAGVQYCGDYINFELEGWEVLTTRITSAIVQTVADGLPHGRSQSWHTAAKDIDTASGRDY